MKQWRPSLRGGARVGPKHQSENSASRSGRNLIIFTLPPSPLLYYNAHRPTHTGAQNYLTNGDPTWANRTQSPVFFATIIDRLQCNDIMSTVFPCLLFFFLTETDLTFPGTPNVLNNITVACVENRFSIAIQILTPIRIPGIFSRTQIPSEQ